MDTTSTWSLGSSADWNSPADWSGGVPNQVTIDATIAVAGAYDVLISNGESFSVGSVELNSSNATLEVGGTLALGGTADALMLTAGTLKLDSGSVLASGTIINAGGALMANGGTLDGVTNRGVLALTGSGQSLFIKNGLTLETAAGGQPGSLDLSGASASAISVLDDGTLDNATLTFDLAGQSDALLTGTGNDSGHTLTLGSGFTIDVSAGNNNLGHYAQTYFADDAGDTLDNDGLINVSSGVLNVYYGTLDNAGSISIDGGGFTLQNGATLNNTGSISISNGSELYLQGPLTTRQLGNFSVATGGSLGFNGLLDNAGATLDIGAGSALGTLDLTSGDTILGGTLIDSGSGLLASGGTLDGVTYQGVLALAGSGQSLFIENGLTLETAAGGQPGSLDLSGASASAISVLDDGTLDNATLTFDLAGQSDALVTGTGNDSGHTLTLGSGFTIDVSAGNNNLGHYAQTYFADDAGDTLDNAGLIDVSSGVLNIYYGNVNNTGSIDIDGGGLTFQNGATFDNSGSVSVSNDSVLFLHGPLTTEQIGDISVSGGGSLRFGGLLDNTGATLDIGASSVLGTLDLTNSDTILGGTIIDSGSGLVANGGTLDGVTYQGVLALAGSGLSLFIENGLTLATAAGGQPGSIDLSGAAGSAISVLDSGTLDNATLTFDAAGETNALVTGTGNDSGQTLTLGSGFTIDESAGTNNLGHYGQDYFADDAGDTLDNDGLIKVSGGVLNIYYGSVNNTGSIDIAGGALNMVSGTTFDNTGTILASDGITGYLDLGNFVNLSTGTLTGGFYGVDNGSTLQFTANADDSLAVDAANVTLNGTGSSIEFYSGIPNSYQPVETTLQEIASDGALAVLDGRDYTTGNDLANAGTLTLGGGTFTAASLTNTGTIDGFGTIADAVDSAGTIDASGGLLDVTGPVTDTGALLIEPAATLELGGATAQSVTFNATSPAGGALTIDTASGFTGTISGFAAGDTIDLAGIGTATSVTLNASDVLTVSGGTVSPVTLNLDPSQDYSADVFVVSPDGNGGSDVEFGPPLSFTTISDPGEAQTQAEGTNDSGVIVGAGADEPAGVGGLLHSFVDTDGSFTNFDISATDVSGASGINSSGTIAGSYEEPLYYGNAYVGTPGDTTTVTPPFGVGGASGAYGINDSGEIIGTTATSSGYEGFLDDGGTFSAVNYPGASITTATAINNAGDIVGSYVDSSGNDDGFLYSSGTYTTINVPGAAQTIIYGINNSGQMVGTSYSATGVRSGFLDNNGTFASINIPIALSLTEAKGINDAGQIVGFYDDSSGNTQGYLTTISDVDAANGLSVICYLAGTQIATPDREVPVESLAIGHRVLTLSGASRPIVWIGNGRVLATRGRRSPATPVIVRKGALGNNVPYCDLRVTKAHSLYIDGVLIPVEFLVNHRSILWDDHAHEVTIYHIELDAHDILLANGAPAESYRDDGNRWLFRNANTGWHLPPQEPCAPVLTGGPVVDAVWRRLLERAGPRQSLPTTDDPDLHLLVDGRRLDAASRSGMSHVFRLTARPAAVRIVSRTGSPQEIGLARDPRPLGVALRRIIMSKGVRTRTIEAEDPSLAIGFHGFEPDDQIRWTDGDAVVPAHAFEGFAGPLELTLCLGGTTRYVDEGTTRRVA